MCIGFATTAARLTGDHLGTLVRVAPTGGDRTFVRCRADATAATVERHAVEHRERTSDERAHRGPGGVRPRGHEPSPAPVPRGTSAVSSVTEPQAVLAPLSRSAVFLVVTVHPDQASRTRVREFCADLPGLVRTVGFRDLEAGLSCVVGFGACPLTIEM